MGFVIGMTKKIGQEMSEFQFGKMWNFVNVGIFGMREIFCSWNVLNRLSDVEI